MSRCAATLILMNFGGFATPERGLLFDINDLDETLPAPWEWDLNRLVASFVLAAPANGLSDATGRDAAVACAAIGGKCETLPPWAATGSDRTNQLFLSPIVNYHFWRWLVGWLVA